MSLDEVGIVPDARVDAHHAQGLQAPGVLGVAAGDDQPLGHHDAGDARHPGPADADDVHPADPGRSGSLTAYLPHATRSTMRAS